jgi:hypothetical protein
MNYFFNSLFISQKMGQTNQKDNQDYYALMQKNRTNFNHHFLIDRFLSTSEEPLITVGVCGPKKKRDNPFACQCIRIGDDELRSMTSYNLTETSLCYEFENNIQLCLLKYGDHSEMVLHLKTPNKNEYRNDIRQYKKINLISPELDLIHDFMKKNDPISRNNE